MSQAVKAPISNGFQSNLFQSMDVTHADDVVLGKRPIKRKDFADYELDEIKFKPKTANLSQKKKKQAKGKMSRKAAEESAANLLQSQLARKKQAIEAAESKSDQVVESIIKKEALASFVENPCRRIQLDKELAKFKTGSIVWAKSGHRKDMFWPAKVIDPVTAPSSVRSVADANQLCVMFFGVPQTEVVEKAFGWVRGSKMFSYEDNCAKYEMQESRHKKRQNEFILACREAALSHLTRAADITQSQHDASAIAAAGFTSTAINDDPSKVVCRSCGDVVPRKSEVKTGRRFVDPDSNVPPDVCESCKTFFLKKQFCSICNKIWLPNDYHELIACSHCDSFLHAECAGIEGKKLQDIQAGSDLYFCHSCSGQRASVKPDPKQERMVQALARDTPPITVICNGVTGKYYPSRHVVVCVCRNCCLLGKNHLQTLSEFERHVGCFAKKWKTSVQTKEGVLLVDWLMDGINKSVKGIAWDPSLKGGVKMPEVEPPKPAKAVKSLREPPADASNPAYCPIYEPIDCIWTSENCAVCFHPNDDAENKMILCNSCQIAVHESCYGYKLATGGGSWICSTCQHPAESRECALCPIKGGILKPTTKEGLWAHLACAVWIPETSITDTENMEPIEGLEKVHFEKFTLLGCSICRQPHGACLQCDGPRCRVAYHPLCALKAGYDTQMEIGKRDNLKKRMFCPSHRPRKENFTDQSSAFLQSVELARLRLLAQGGKTKGYRERQLASVPPPGMLHVRHRNGPEEDQSELSMDGNPSRCFEFDRQKMDAWKGKGKKRAVPYDVGGARVHKIQKVLSLQPQKEVRFSTRKERLRHISATISERIQFGKSAIHDWGLMAKRKLNQGEMIFEYCGWVMRKTVGDLKEELYKKMGMDNYLFALDEDTFIDSTTHGNIVRLINHSCNPNCYTKVMDKDEGEENGHIVFYARRDIEVGEELTYDYKFEIEEDAEDKVPCFCQSHNCRKYLN